MNRLVLAALAAVLVSSPVSAQRDAGVRGARNFPGLHALSLARAGSHMTSPSLAGLWRRKAGSLESFESYSDRRAEGPMGGMSGV
ncbi:cytochrome c2 [Bradyrhizobium sp. S3.2.12]